MNKNKDGKVVASLTEVKNKTGDIFAVVDEYGEIILTSYNKPRYRVTKIDLAESLGLGESKVKAEKKKAVSAKSKSAPTKQKVTVTKTVEKVVAPVTAVETPKATTPQQVSKEETIATKQEEPTPAANEQAESEANEVIANLVPWNSESTVELTYIQEITRPIQ